MRRTTGPLSHFSPAYAIGCSEIIKWLLPPIDIVETHDVVLAEIAANLNLDQFQRDFSRIGEPMNAADRDVHGFVLMHAADLVVHRDLRGSLHDDPVLRPMEVFLQ